MDSIEVINILKKAKDSNHKVRIVMEGHFDRPAGALEFISPTNSIVSIEEIIPPLVFEEGKFYSSHERAPGRWYCNGDSLINVEKKSYLDLGHNFFVRNTDPSNWKEWTE